MSDLILPTNHEAASADSWLGLLASTVGTEFSRLRVRVFAEAQVPVAARLVVQAFRVEALDERRGFLKTGYRPLAAAQRKVSRGALLRGVEVNLLQSGVSLPGEVLIVAWVELGEPDLEFDGHRALPGAEAVVGSTRARIGETATVRLQPVLPGPVVTACRATSRIAAA